MASIYRNAVVTLLADASPDSTNGMFNSRSLSILDQTPHVTLTKDASGGKRNTKHFVSSQFLKIKDDIEFSPPSTRRWCCQERAAFSRILRFSEEQLFWECMHTSKSEDNVARWHSSRGFKDIVFHDASLGPVNVEEWQDRWYHSLVADDYSAKTLTYSDDKFNAISGIASVFQRLRPERYLAGHWEESLIPSLCWNAERIHDKNRKTTAYRAPSWSWASQDCQVSWLLTFTTFEPVAALVAVDTVVEPSYPLGEVYGGFLTLRAPALKVHVERKHNDQPPNYPFHSPGRIYFEDQHSEEVILDDADLDAGEAVACFIGTDAWDTGEHYSWYALLLRQKGDSFTRIGMMNRLLGLSESDSDEQEVRQMEALVQQAPRMTFTII